MKLSLAFIAIALALSGCLHSPPAKSPPPRSGAIIEVNLLAMPVALNLDSAPGADGVQVNVFLVAKGRPETVPLTTGALEVLAFDGTATLDRLPAPFHVWRFAPNTLAPSEIHSVVGTGYNLVLSWAPKILAGKRVTLVAKYLPPQGEPVLSAPSSIAATSL